MESFMAEDGNIDHVRIIRNKINNERKKFDLTKNCRLREIGLEEI